MPDFRLPKVRARLGDALLALPGDTWRRLLFVAALAAAPALAPFVGDSESLLFLAAIAVGGPFLIFRPYWGVLAISAFWMLDLDPVRVGPLNTVYLVGLVLLIPLAMDISRERRIWFLEVPQIWLALGIGLVLLAATAWSVLMHPPPPHEVYEKTWDELRLFAKNLVILILFVSFVKTPRHIVAAVAVLLFVILFFAYEALDVPGGGPGAARAEAVGLAEDSNRLGSLCVWGTALFWALRFHFRARWWRPLTLLPLLGLPFVALLTASRSALLQLLILAALIFLQQRHWSPAERVRSFALVLAVTFLILIAVPSASLLRATSYGTETGTPGANSTRTRAYAVWTGVMMAAEHPLFGVGPGNFRWRLGLGRNANPHNSYLWALTSGGPALLALYLMLLYRTYRGLATAERSGPPELQWVAKGLRLSLIGFLLFSFFADVWQQQPFYLLVGLAIALARHSRSSGGARVGPIALRPAVLRPA